MRSHDLVYHYPCLPFSRHEHEHELPSSFHSFTHTLCELYIYPCSLIIHFVLWWPVFPRSSDSANMRRALELHRQQVTTIQRHELTVHAHNVCTHERFSITFTHRYTKASEARSNLPPRLHSTSITPNLSNICRYEVLTDGTFAVSTNMLNLSVRLRVQ